MKDNPIEFRELFVWSGDTLEDVRFWCEPKLTNQALLEIEKKFDLEKIDGFVALEARGFYLAGVASSLFQKPVVMVRKHKKFFEKMQHETITFKNWKGEMEALTVLLGTLPKVKNVLVVDDIIDTGASLVAARSLLSHLDIQLSGAFYLLNALKFKNSNFQNIKIESIWCQKLFA